MGCTCAENNDPLPGLFAVVFSPSSLARRNLHMPAAGGHGGRLFVFDLIEG